MRTGLWSLVAATSFAVASAATAEPQPRPQPLSFSVGEARHVVPPTELSSLEVGEEIGLTLCFSEAQQQALQDFTGDHIGDTVTVSIGETKVFFLQIVEPYDGGCIDWPLHPRVAESYRARLTGSGGDE